VFRPFRRVSKIVAFNVGNLFKDKSAARKPSQHRDGGTPRLQFC